MAVTPFTSRTDLRGLPASSRLVAGISTDERAVESTVACVDSTDLLHGQKALTIHHNGLSYRLQTTRLGKLILTK